MRQGASRAAPLRQLPTTPYSREYLPLTAYLLVPTHALLLSGTPSLRRPFQLWRQAFGLGLGLGLELGVEFSVSVSVRASVRERLPLLLWRQAELVAPGLLGPTKWDFGRE